MSPHAPPPPRRRRGAAITVALAALVLAACGSAGASDEQPSGTVGGVGVLPDQSAGEIATATTAPGAGATTTTGETTLPSDSTAPTAPPEVTAEGVTLPPSIGVQVTGNKLLMVGDSIFAGTASRYGGEACATLVPLDWQVDVEAESGRAIDFGERVIKQMLPKGWDVIVFFLGTNYGGNEVGYRDYLVRILDRIGPDIPVVLLTTTRYAAKQDEVNTILREEAEARDNVTLLDWGTISEGPGLLSGDGYHPSPEGRQVLVDSIAYIVGQAPTGPGKCVGATNTSDIPNTPGAPTGPSKGSGSSGSGSGSSGSSGSGSSGSGSSKTSTTAPTGSGGSGGSGSDGSGSGGSGGSPTTVGVPDRTLPNTPTAPPATQAPATQPPATQPPATQPPATQPPATQAPATQAPAPPTAAPPSDGDNVGP